MELSDEENKKKNSTFDRMALTTFYMHYTYSILSKHLAASTQFTASLASCI